MIRLFQVLVGDNSFGFSQEIVRALNSENFYAYLRRGDCKLLYSEIIKEKPDVVLLNLAFIKGDVLELISKVNEKIDSVLFVIMTPYTYNDFQIKLEEVGCLCINLPCELNIIEDIILERCIEREEKTTNSYNGIKNFISKYNFGKGKGFKYITEAVYIKLANIFEYQKMGLELYPYLAEKFNSKPENIERCIRYSIKISFEKDEDLLSNLIKEFGYQYISNANVIKSLVLKYKSKFYRLCD